MDVVQQQAMAEDGGREARVRNAVAFLKHPKVREEVGGRPERERRRS